MKDIEFLEYQVIADRSLAFLTQYGEASSMPMPVEEIAEIKIGLEIIPLPNLQRDYDIEGFMSSDFSTIYVDEYVFSNVEVRYRFTLAHELGHYVLHRDFLGQFAMDSMVDWIRILTNFDNRVHSKLEFQGYAFGGLMLAPQKQLKEMFQKNLPQVLPLIEQAQNAGLSKYQYMGNVVDFMASCLSPIFNASTDVLKRRIKLDNLDKFIP